MVYVPGKLPPLETEDGKALAGFLEDELQRIASSTIDDVLALELRPSTAAPLRPREGMVVYADGTSWDPADGEGPYVYTNGAWKLMYAPTWIVYSPTVTSAAGTLTTLGTVSARYLRMGKTVFLEYDISITTNGTGSGSISVTLPINAAAFAHCGAGRENSVSGKMLQGTIAVSGTIMTLRFYDNTYPGANGCRFFGSMFYEIA